MSVERAAWHGSAKREGGRAPIKSKAAAEKRRDNVFGDLGFSDAASEHLLVRSKLMVELQKRLAARKLKQADAAKVLGVTQPRVSNLLQGRIDLFSTDTLVDMLARVDVKVRVVLKPAGKSRLA